MMQAKQEEHKLQITKIYPNYVPFKRQHKLIKNRPKSIFIRGNGGFECEALIVGNRHLYSFTDENPRPSPVEGEFFKWSYHLPQVRFFVKQQHKDSLFAALKIQASASATTFSGMQKSLQKKIVSFLKRDSKTEIKADDSCCLLDAWVSCSDFTEANQFPLLD